jgi:hypothetical protein
MEETLKNIKSQLSEDDFFDYCEFQVDRVTSRIDDIQDELKEFIQKLETSEHRNIIKQCIDGCRDDIKQLNQELIFYKQNLEKLK